MTQTDQSDKWLFFGGLNVAIRGLEEAEEQIKLLANDDTQRFSPEEMKKWREKSLTIFRLRRRIDELNHKHFGKLITPKE